MNNNILEAAPVTPDVYERMQKTYVTVPQSVCFGDIDSKTENSSMLLDFLNSNHIASASRLSPEVIDQQIREELEMWD